MVQRPPSAASPAAATASDPSTRSATTRPRASWPPTTPTTRSTKIDDFFLNFDAADAARPRSSDGKDRLFGDVGNDWLVGGTQQRPAVRRQGRRPAQRRRQPRHQRRAEQPARRRGVRRPRLRLRRRRAGRADRQHRRRPAVRLGRRVQHLLRAVQRRSASRPSYRFPSPHIQQFLLDLGRESGADQSLTEPNGELGLFTQSDPQWQQNHGGPRDPQPGNIAAPPRHPGGPGGRPRHGPAAHRHAAARRRPARRCGNSTDVTVDAVFVDPDPSNPARLALFVGGTNGADTIVVRQGTTAGTSTWSSTGWTGASSPSRAAAVSIGRIIVYGNDGNDTITVNPNVGAIDAVLYGGAGNDTIRGGPAAATSSTAATGTTSCWAAPGRDVLVGGLGRTHSRGAADDDVLIGGTYRFSEDLDALAEVLGAWTTSQSYDDRVAALTGVAARAQHSDRLRRRGGRPDVRRVRPGLVPRHRSRLVRPARGRGR